jgi:hypothetical protein
MGGAIQVWTVAYSEKLCAAGLPIFLSINIGIIWRAIEEKVEVKGGILRLSGSAGEERSAWKGFRDSNGTGLGLMGREGSGVVPW